MQILLLVVLAIISYASCFHYKPTILMKTKRSVKLYAKEDDQTIKDLNLEEMFDVFEAADKKIKDSDVLPTAKTITEGNEVSKVEGEKGFDPSILINYAFIIYLVYLGVDTIRILVTSAINGPAPST